MFRKPDKAAHRAFEVLRRQLMPFGAGEILHKGQIDRRVKSTSEPVWPRSLTILSNTSMGDSP